MKDKGKDDDGPSGKPTGPVGERKRTRYSHVVIELSLVIGWTKQPRCEIKARNYKRERGRERPQHKRRIKMRQKTRARQNEKFILSRRTVA